VNALKFTESMPIHPIQLRQGFNALGIRGSDIAMDPYLMVDHFRMSEPTFEPHPHAGFSAVTVMFEDSENSFLNRDSRGDHSVIGSGDLHWTTAGKGVIHDEVPTLKGKVAHGLQLFVNLVAAKKQIEPQAIHLSRDLIPKMTLTNGGSVRIPFGECTIDGKLMKSPAAIPTNVTLLDITLSHAGAIAIPQEHDQNMFVYIVSGRIHNAFEQHASAGEAWCVESGNGTLNLVALEEAHIVAFIGQPIKEPVVRHGPFAMNTEAQIQDAIRAYRAGEMGELKPL
jgi:redox-sensitive bicupin YhaK (pirin superfamily)